MQRFRRSNALLGRNRYCVEDIAAVVPPAGLSDGTTHF